MRINPSQLHAYARDVSRPAARAGSVKVGPPGEAIGTIQGVLTPEESRFIAGLFPRQDGQHESAPRVNQAYTYGSRPISGYTPGIRLDLKA